MNERTLYSITALFDTPDEIIHAAEEVAGAGYTRFDVNTPYPVHGMDKAMKLRQSRLGVFTFFFGLLGTVSIVAFMTWITISDYPLVIGGKPFWTWPAFVPIAFEITVLMAAVLTVATMIVLFFKFPNNSHPLHDTPYMKRVSSDKYGISIQADDPKFNEKSVRDLLKSLGGEEIAEVHFDLEDLDHKQKLFDPRFLGVLALTALLVSGGTYLVFNKVLTMQPFTWMFEQSKLKAQKPSDLFKDGIGMRPPVEGTVARGFLPYPFKGKPDEAGKYLVNPLLPTAGNLERGKTRFLTYCSPCHGNFGRGDSRLRGQFPNPPTLHSDKVRNWPDGNIYHVITEGQNVMPSYATQVARDDRWAIILYIRALQRAQHAKESDLK
ncbi:MAG TPA: quinol:electron acceptor oxidoreductase subunit ActD [Bacteroidota bacterium]|nr:quinol:electron acceptor oxidoreductase subunit ActD [Bacteroidota bacterium]